MLVLECRGSGASGGRLFAGDGAFSSADVTDVRASDVRRMRKCDVIASRILLASLNYKKTTCQDVIFINLFHLK